jgi:hypothetical protein
MTSTHSAGTNQQHQNDTPPEVRLVVHHQFPGIELISPVYACENATCHLSPDQKVDAGSTTQIGFNITNFSQGPSWRKPIGTLMYELKRKNTKQFNKNVISSEDEAARTQFVIRWEVNESKEFRVKSYPMECNKRETWNGDRLMRMDVYRPIFSIYVPIEITYLMRDSTVLMTRANVTYEEKCYKLEITISEGSIKDDTQRIQYYGTGR